jgi:Zn-dependent M28 family amino/carboxypeptidase
LAARRLVVDALRDAGLDPFEQGIEEHGGANVLATIPGDVDRWVLVAAHYDHLGIIGGDVFRGADDNAAAVAILVDVARALVAKRAAGRGVIVAAFDAEEPPYFLSDAMGSEHFARHPTVDLSKIDMMVCMDLVGHALGSEEAPDTVRNSVFALGAERSEGTSEVVREVSVPGVFVRPVDAEVIPPLSDYHAFWERKRPFLLLTNARSRIYHTPEDVPSLLAWDKMAATAKWLEQFVRASCSREPEVVTFQNHRDDASTLVALDALLTDLAELSPQAEMGLQMSRSLRDALRADGTLPESRRQELAMLVAGLESGLA